MIKLSNFPIKTLKTRPKISDNISTGILLQAGFIRQTMAGVYNYTTLGLKVLRNIENIVREEMDNYGASEILMSALSPKENWEKTGRWDLIDVLFKLPTGNEGKEYGLNSTHEEIVTPLMSEFINSYKDSGTCIYQIQTKFRNEKRAKSGLLRGREFLMKDAYSFHIEGGDFDEYYEGMKKVYMKIFDRLGLATDTYITLASGGDFTEKYSHEFQVVLPIGEDDIYICDSCGTSHNKEIVDLENGFSCTKCKQKEYRIEKASEVGNIFPLETKFSKPFGLKMLDKNNKNRDVLMGCYGIGISRLMGVIAEYFMNDKGISWPESIAPADYYIVVMGEFSIEKAEDLVKRLESKGKTVILDDRMGRKYGFGQKMTDAELFGIPKIIVISDKTIEKGGFELLERGEREGEIINF